MKNRLINKRSLRFGSYSVALTVIVIAAAVILNAIVGATQIRDKLKIDLTSQKFYSVGEKTDGILKDLTKEVEIIGLFDEGNNSQYAQVVEFLKQYEVRSNKIRVRYVDPDKNPAFIQELDPDGVRGVQRNSFVVRSDKRMKVLSYYDIFEQTLDQTYYQFYISGLNAEYAFTSAIRYVAAEEIPVLYYTQGHGEGGFDTEYSELKSSIELHGYEVKPLWLATAEKVPEDASVVLVAGPEQDLTVQEMEKLLVYMENGGNTIFLFDPLQNNPKLPNFEEFLSEYNLGLDYNVIFEMAANRAYPGQPYIFMPNVENTEITESLDPGKLTMTMVYARSILILKNQKEWITNTPLLTTSSEAIGKPLNQDEADTFGPFNIAVAAENKGKAKPSRTVVTGNAFFAADDGLDSNGSGKKFILSALNWLQDEETDIYIPAKKYTVPRLPAVTQQTLTILFIGLIIVVPLIIIGIGVFVWLRRRHL